ncbi:hypothetical protein BS78_06G012900 [Paspalum vaginatum]|nr:hypothetical protein BS78_06G012900 [Paspalum vaginatum]
MSDDGSSQRPPWQEGLDAYLRKRVLEKIEMKLTEIYHGPLHSTDEIHNAASKYETRTFEGASSKEEYLRTISQRLVSLEQRQKQKRVQQGAASGLQQQHPVQPVNAVQATHGGNSSVSSSSSQAASALSNDGRRSSQMQSLPTTSPASGLVPNQHMAACPSAPNMQIKVNQEQPEVNSCQASVTPPASGVQHTQRMVPSAATQNSNQLSAGQMQLANFLGCDPATLVQPLDRPNRKKNPFLRQNAKGTDQLTVNQQGLGFNRQPMDRDKSQMLGVMQHPNAANKTHNDHPEAHNSQQNPAGMTVGLQSMLKVREQEAPDKHINIEHQPIGAQQLITVSQQNSSHCTLPQTSATTGSAGEVDWRDEMFLQIKQLKDVYLSDLLEMNQVVTVPNITEEQLESLPKDKAEKYRFNVHMKKKITMMLRFLLFQKSNIPENLRGQLPMFLKSIQDLVGCYKKSKARKEEMDERHRSQISHGHRQIVNLSGDLVPSGGSASHQKQQEQPTVSQLKENTVPTTPVAPQQIHSNRLLGVERSSFTEKSRISPQSLPAHMLQERCGPSPVTKPGVATVSSPSPSLKSTSPSPDSMLGALKAKTSPSVAVKSTFPSLVAKPGVVEGSTPSTSVKSTLPSHFAESAAVQAALPCASSKSKLPSPLAQLADTEAASPRALVKSTLPSLVANSGLAPVASVCSSVEPTSSENVDSVYALLLEDNSAAATASAHAAIGGAITAAANCSKQVTVATAAAQAAIVGATEAEANGDQQVTCTNSIMPASPLQAQTADILEGDNNRGGAETLVAKKPIDRLLDAVRAASTATLHSSANSLFSVVHMNDWQPHSETDASQNWAFLSHQGGSHTTNKLKRAFESTSSYFESPPLGFMDGSRMAFARAGSETEPSVGGGARMQKKQRTRVALSDEINSVNHMLLDTVISIDSSGMDGITSSNRERLITLSYTGMSLAPDLKLLLATSGMSAVMPPMKLLVPVDYPRRSPVIVHDLGDKRPLTMSDDVSSVADEAFWRSLRVLPEPMSVRDMATAWDQSVRRAVVEFARQYGGGTISSTYGQWERF